MKNIVNGKRQYRRKLIKGYDFNLWLNSKSKKIIIFFIPLSFLIISILLLFRYNSYSMIEEYIEQKEYVKSLKLINKLLREEENDYTALKQKGKIYTILSLERDDLASYNYKESVMPKEAVAIYSKIIEEVDGEASSEVYFFMGLGLFFLGKEEYSKSLEFIEKAIELNESDGEIYSYIKEKKDLVLNINDAKYYFTVNALCAYLSFQTGDYEKSISYFKKAILEKEEAIYNLYLGLCYFNLKDFEKAESNFLFLIDREQNEGILEQGYIFLSRIAFGREDYEGAEKYIRSAIDISPSAESYYQIGLIYERKKQLGTAFDFWLKALKLDPENSKARHRIIRFEKKLSKRKR